MQYSKLFTAAVGAAYFAQVVTTMVLVCSYSEAASALLDILKTTTGLFGLIFGCYTGNSAVEKVVSKKSVVDAALRGSSVSQTAEG